MRIVSNLPTKGWTVEDVTELDMHESTSCQYCGTTIRWVYTLSHPQQANNLDVGSECAARMSTAYCATNDKRMRATARRKESRKRNWSTRQWERSPQGNLTLATKDAGRITIYKTRLDGWKFVVGGKHSPNNHDSEREARDSAFEAYWDAINTSPINQA